MSRFCLLVSLLLILVATPAGAGEAYNRIKHFGAGWIDADHDCQDTRQEVLIRDSLVPPVLSADGCNVLTGQWVCPYTGEVFTDPSRMDIDHMVPLAEAWRSGADQWPEAKRIAYANDLGDPRHLLPTQAGANRAKGDKGPEAFLPTEGRYHYAQEWVRIKTRWKLTFNAEEVAGLLAVERQYGGHYGLGR